MSEIWVKVIKANPLKGPCEGQVQFVVDWERRKATHRDWVWFSYGGKKHKTSLAGGYATVKENFRLVMPSVLVIDWYIVMNDGRKFDLGSFLPSEPGTPLVPNPSRVSMTEATEAEPPEMRVFHIFFGDSNDRREYGYRTHWDAWKLARKLIPEFFTPYGARQARANGIDGDEEFAVYAMAHTSHENTYTLSVENAGLAKDFLEPD